jgi:hypothetical protein
MKMKMKMKMKISSIFTSMAIAIITVVNMSLSAQSKNLINTSLSAIEALSGTECIEGSPNTGRCRKTVTNAEACVYANSDQEKDCVDYK